VGILAHVDAGKTSLTERLLYAAGVIDEVGSVDDGDTQTDTLALERRRGITIKSAVVSFVIDDVLVNLIDTPGHPDFIAEVERVLDVLDGAVLVVSAVEGVQAQTRVLTRTLRRLGVPTLIFVNKVDRGGARDEEVLREIAEKLTSSIVPMGVVHHIGTREARVVPYGEDDPAFRARLVEVLADYDDEVLADFVEGNAVPAARLRASLAARSRQASVYPVLFGSAITGTGVAELMSAMTELLPATAGEVVGPVSGTVFKIERGAGGERIAYVRMHTGTVRTRDRIRFGEGKDAKVTAISVFERGTASPSSLVQAGRIAKMWGLADVQIGDRIGATDRLSRQPHFAPPTLEAVIVPRRGADKGRLHTALVQLAEQDPLINLRQDDARQEIFVSLYGEVQKEVIQATLADDYGIDVEFRETTTICVERPVGVGEAAEFLGANRVSTHHSVAPTMVEPNPFLATVGLRVEPAPTGSGIEFRLGVEPGAMPPAFFKAVEESVRQTLRQGLYGWEVADCLVTMTHAGYAPRQGRRGVTFDPRISSAANDFRALTPLVLMAALRRAGTRVLEPLHHFRLEVPSDTVGALLPALAAIGAVPRTQQDRETTSVIEGDIPAAQVHTLRRKLPGLTRGESALESRFDRYAPVRGRVPVRPRTGHNPLNRKEYLRSVRRT
jgi:ribosomal protection tetracycline resistance protein